MAWQEMDFVIDYGRSADHLDQRVPSFRLAKGGAKSVVMDGLKPDSEGFYRLSYRFEGDSEVILDPVRRFHTQRAAGTTFEFVIQADSHLDVSTDVGLYQQTLANMRADQPDFMIDLGDTTMVDKFGAFFMRAESQYRAQRYYMGQISHSVPIFLTLGNHDGEQGSRLTGAPNSMPLWSVGMRKRYFPNPEPGGIYTGNSKPFDEAGLLQDYYAWTWGDALFIVLDPFWPTTERNGQDNWSMTLGEDQYRWLAKTLQSHQTAFKFVFIHHLVGGLGKDVRGGVAPAPYMEWGGKNADGTDGFAEHRPGWEMPIHPLLVKNGVSIVFHGHDHLFVKEELDGLIYQEVPQPGHPSGGTRSAGDYGYTGVILGSSGHLRVTVGPSEASVDYVRSIVPGVTRESEGNGRVEHSYKVTRR
jgi:predicted phosphodiesterase